jgi:hypothetical protein
MSTIITEINIKNYKSIRGPGSSVGIATELRAGRSDDRIPVGARFSASVQTGPGAHPAPCTMGTGSFPRVKFDRGLVLTTHPLLVPWSWKSKGIPLPTLCATPGLQRVYFTFYKSTQQQSRLQVLLPTSQYMHVQ